LKFQRLLFGDDTEARAQEVERLATLEEQTAYTEARKLAWLEGNPFPEDQAKWCAAHRELVNARSREAYRGNYVSVTEYYLRSTARSRAKQLGCKIGRRGPILKVYRRAVHSTLLLCYWCKKLTFPGERHVDHKQPLATGGAHVAGNLRITCVECNLAKGDISPADFQKIVAEKRVANSLVACDYFRQLAAPLASSKTWGE
jgi:5-methylcytosine-specific restriction endonuclease McrA